VQHGTSAPFGEAAEKASLTATVRLAVEEPREINAFF
jgi:hypothetical protein